MSYNPQPTRVWSRVQHPCTFTLDVSYNSVFSPLTRRTTSLLESDYYNKLLYKGNILQYKKNTSNLTKSQRYSQICKGMWTNRTKSYATQTQTYTNPNTSNLKQVNFINVPTNGNTTYIPGPYNFNIPAPNGCPSNSIKDGGSLLCNTIVNPCTNEVIDVTTVLECYPTSCSDVPGPVIDLCWNSKLDTWYPRQNLTMNNSADKWPEGYKGFVSAVTGCYNDNNNDLPPSPPPPVAYIATGEYTTGSNLSYNTIITFTGNGTILFNIVRTVIYTIVGGGAGGESGFNGGAGGGAGGQGGGGGSVVNSNFISSTGVTYTLTIGNGGSPGVIPSSGVDSIITIVATVVATATGGLAGAGGAGGAGGAPINNFGVDGSSGSIGTSIYGGGGGGGGGGGSYTGSAGVYARGGDAGVAGAGGAGGYRGSDNLLAGYPGGSALLNTGCGGGGGGGGGSINGAGGVGGSGGSGIIILYFNV